MLQLFTVPTAASFLSDAGAWSTVLITALLVVAAVIVGILAAGMFSSKLISAVVSGIAKVTGRGKGGRKRRR